MVTSSNSISFVGAMVPRPAPDLPLTPCMMTVVQAVRLRDSHCSGTAGRAYGRFGMPLFRFWDRATSESAARLRHRATALSLHRGGDAPRGAPSHGSR